MLRRLRSPRHSREQGAVAVETALVSLLLLTIMYGVVETSFLFRDALVVSSASRAGARMASSMPKDPTFAAATRIQVEDALSGMNMARVSDVWVYYADPVTGKPPSTNYTTCNGRCIRFTGSATGLVVATTNTGSWTSAQQNACAGEPDSVGVYVRYAYPTRVGLFNGKQLSEQTVMRLEPFVGGSACKP